MMMVLSRFVSADDRCASYTVYHRLVDAPIFAVNPLSDGFSIQLWDPRQRDCLRTYRQHFDYITDFLWLGDKKQLVATRCVAFGLTQR